MLEWKNSDEEKRSATFQKWMLRFAVVWGLVIVVLAIVINSGCVEGGSVEVDAGEADAEVDAVDYPLCVDVCMNPEMGVGWSCGDEGCLCNEPQAPTAIHCSR